MNGRLQVYDECRRCSKRAQLLKVSCVQAVRRMNAELTQQGYLTMAGKIPRAYWARKMYGYELSAG